MSETITERRGERETGVAAEVEAKRTGTATEKPSFEETAQERSARASEGRVAVTLVMPTMNEEAGVGDCIRRARAAFERLGVEGEIVVSDSSTDRTPDIARELGATVVTPDRRGYGYAYRYAFEFARGDYVAIADADCTYDFADLPALVALVDDGADMAIGSRLRGRIDPGAMPPLHRYVGNPLLTWLLNRLYGLRVSDAHSGFRVMRRDALERLELQSDGMEFASELITAAAAAGFDIREAPIVYHARAGETKLHSFRDGWRHVWFMLRHAPRLAPLFDRRDGRDE